MEIDNLSNIEEEKLFNLSQKVEALLFSVGGPISLGKLKNAIEIESVKEIKEAIEFLNDFYVKTQRSFHILEIAGGYQIYTRPQYAEIIGKIFKTKDKKLKQPSLETMAIVAYKQPVTKSEIEKIRGVSVDSPLKSLLERNLIKVAGRGEGPGKPVLYASTPEFLRYFQLKSLNELPPIEDFSYFEEILKNEKKHIWNKIKK